MRVGGKEERKGEPDILVGNVVETFLFILLSLFFQNLYDDSKIVIFIVLSH